VRLFLAGLEDPGHLDREALAAQRGRLEVEEDRKPFRHQASFARKCGG
jgi:hypothetical protein